MPRSVQSSIVTSRTSRPRINTNRTRPYHDVTSRPNAPRKSSTPCKYFQSGKCLASDTCRYQHILAPPAQVTEELDRQLLAFVSDDTPTPVNFVDGAAQASPEDLSPSSALTPSTASIKVGVLECELSDDEELYEVVPHPGGCVSELRYHSTLHPNQPRTYFVAQRQTVVGYEGNNVGVLSGGVLLGVPGALQQASSVTENANGSISEEIYDSEATRSSSPSSVSNGSEVEVWKGPVNFDDAVITDRLDWADDEFTQASMEGFMMPPATPPSPPRRSRVSHPHTAHNMNMQDNEGLDTIPELASFRPATWSSTMNGKALPDRFASALEQDIEEDMNQPPPSFAQSEFETIIRRQKNNTPHGLKIVSAPSRFPHLDNDWEFSGWGTVSYAEITEDQLQAARKRLSEPQVQMGQFRASSISGNGVVGSVFYAFPAVAAVASVFSPLALL
ncbi:hypothetical protein FRC12_002625, partial [Ceratobasidium sp. 428]